MYVMMRSYRVLERQNILIPTYETKARARTLNWDWSQFFPPVVWLGCARPPASHRDDAMVQGHHRHHELQAAVSNDDDGGGGGGGGGAIIVAIGPPSSHNGPRRPPRGTRHRNC